MQHNNPRIRWHGERNARLGFLVGLGWTAEQIAADCLIRSTCDAVRRQATRMNLSFREVPTAIIAPDVMTVFDREAERYAFNGRQLLQRLLSTVAAEPNLIHSVVDMEG